MKNIEPNCQCLVIGISAEHKKDQSTMQVTAIEKCPRGTKISIVGLPHEAVSIKKTGWKIDAEVAAIINSEGKHFYVDTIPEEDLIRIDGFEGEEEKSESKNLDKPITV